MLQAKAKAQEEENGDQELEEDGGQGAEPQQIPFDAKKFEMQIKEQLHDLIEEKVDQLKKLRKDVFEQENREKDIDQMFVNAVQIKLFLDPKTKNDYELRPVN